MAASYFYTKTGLSLGETWQFHLSKVWVWWGIYYQFNVTNNQDSSSIYIDFSISGDNGSTFLDFYELVTSPIATPTPSVIVYPSPFTSLHVGPTTAFRVAFTGNCLSATMDLQITGR